MSTRAAAMALEPDELTERYRTHRSAVLGLCRRLLGSADQAEDAAHEVFLRAHRARRAFDATRPFSAWILGIASHYCIDQLRRRGTETRLFGREDVERAAAGRQAPGPLGALLDDERRRALQDAVAALPPRYRVPLVLAVYHERTYEQIGRELGIGRSHVAVLVFRARQILRERLAGSAPGPGPRRHP